MCPASATVNSDSSPWSRTCAIFNFFTFDVGVSCAFFGGGCRSTCVFEWIDIYPSGPIFRLSLRRVMRQTNPICAASTGVRSRSAPASVSFATLTILDHNRWEQCHVAWQICEGAGMLLDCGNDKHVEANRFDDSIDGFEILRFLLCRKESHDEAARASNSFLTILKEALQRFLCCVVKSATHRYPRRPRVDVALQHQQTKDPYWEVHGTLGLGGRCRTHPKIWWNQPSSWALSQSEAQSMGAVVARQPSTIVQ